LAARDYAGYKKYWDIYGEMYRHKDNIADAIAMTSYRHNEKAVINFADGHAGPMNKEDIFTYDDSDNPVDAINDQLWLVHDF
jgi:prepilin-type processing-associated H-X9-DG protein